MILLVLLLRRLSLCRVSQESLNRCTYLRGGSGCRNSQDKIFKTLLITIDNLLLMAELIEKCLVLLNLPRECPVDTSVLVVTLDLLDGVVSDGKRRKNK